MDAGMTTLVTVISGVLVFALSEVLREIWLDPLNRYKELKGRIAYSLVFYANIVMNPIISNTAGEKQIEEHNNASLELRKLAAETTGFAQTIVIRWGMPSKEVFDKVQTALIGLSNSTSTSQANQLKQIEVSEKRITSIKSGLKIYGE